MGLLGRSKASKGSLAASSSNLKFKALLRPLFFLGVMLVALCSMPLAAEANLLFLGKDQQVTTFDIYWGFRRQRIFNVTGSLVNYERNFTGPDCKLVLDPTNVKTTDIIHVHLPSVESKGCATISSITTGLQEYYLHGTVFSALLVTLGIEEAGSPYLTPWGNPSDLESPEFSLSIGPSSSEDSLLTLTSNYTLSPLVQMTSDAGPWNDRFRGPPAVIYYAIFTTFYSIIFIFTVYLQIDQYRRAGKWFWRLNTMIYLFIKLFIICQLLYFWLPAYPDALTQFFFLCSYTVGFVAYTMVLLTWVKVVSLDRKGKAALSASTAKAMHIFNYFAIALFVVIAIVFFIRSIFPQSYELSYAVYALFIILPILLLSQAVLFLFYGIRLISILKGFGTNISEQRRALLIRMSVLLASSVATFLTFATVSIVSITSLTLNVTWAATVLNDVSALTMIGIFIFTLHVSKSAQASSSTTGTPKTRMNLHGTHSDASNNPVSGLSPASVVDQSTIEFGVSSTEVAILP